MLSEGSNKTLIRHYSGLIQALLRRYDIYFFFMLDYEQHSQQNYILYNKIIFCFFLTCLWHSSVHSNSLTYPSLSDMLLLQCPQNRRTPLDVAELYSKEQAAGVLRRHGAKRGAEL